MLRFVWMQFDPYFTQAQALARAKLIEDRLEAMDHEADPKTDTFGLDYGNAPRWRFSCVDC